MAHYYNSRHGHATFYPPLLPVVTTSSTSRGSLHVIFLVHDLIKRENNKLTLAFHFYQTHITQQVRYTYVLTLNTNNTLVADKSSTNAEIPPVDQIYLDSLKVFIERCFLYMF